MAASAARSAAVQAAVLGAAQAVEAAVDAKIDALDAALNDTTNASDESLAQLRARRLAQLRADAEARLTWEQQGHGALHRARSDKEFFDAARGAQRCVACFVRSSASRPCDAMERLLSQLAPKHLEAKFVMVDAEKCPFLADRMRVSVLPTVAVLVEGKAEGYQVGFDGLEGGDRCSASALEARLVELGALRPEGVSMFAKSSNAQRMMTEKHGSGMVRGGSNGNNRRGDEDEDSDFD